MIEIYDNGGETANRYSVRIGSSVFGMSENALSPQGFNQYAGEVEDLPGWRRGFYVLDPRVLPEAVRLAILDRLWVSSDSTPLCPDCAVLDGHLSKLGARLYRITHPLPPIFPTDWPGEDGVKAFEEVYLAWLESSGLGGTAPKESNAGR